MRVKTRSLFGPAAVLVSVALLAAACAEPADVAAEPVETTTSAPPQTTTTTTTAPATPSEEDEGSTTTVPSTSTTTTAPPQTTTTTTSTTTTTTTVIATDTASYPMLRKVASALELPPALPIDPPEGFPTLDELAEIDPWFDPPPQRDARISSWFYYLEENQVAHDELGPGPDGVKVTITYLDPFIIREWDGYREAQNQVDGGWYEWSDGSWVELEFYGEGPPFGPITEWEAINIADIVALGAEFVGYESIAGTPTLHLSVEIEEGDYGLIDLWLDEYAAPFRILAAIKEENETSWIVIAWDVETLAPEFTDPLPPGA